ncbi:MAG: hypothetical protein WAV93_07560 [Bacteroidales bacterium]
MKQPLLTGISAVSSLIALLCISCSTHATIRDVIPDDRDNPKTEYLADKERIVRD